MTLLASLPMYNFPEMRLDNARFWTAMRSLLIDAGLKDVPETLVFERGPVPPALEDSLLFSQTCGYPLETVFKGQAIRLGTPVYDAPGCDGATHRAYFVVRRDSPVQSLADLRGSVFLLNSAVSNSGMNLPRRALAKIAGSKPFFRAVIETGSHPASLDRLLRGEGDVASIDCVTYAFSGRHRPEAAARARVLADTPVSPAIPFVTSVATPPNIIDLLRNTLRRVASEPRYAATRSGLMLAAIEDVPDTAYAGFARLRSRSRSTWLSTTHLRGEIARVALLSDSGRSGVAGATGLRDPNRTHRAISESDT